MAFLDPSLCQKCQECVALRSGAKKKNHEPRPCASYPKLHPSEPPVPGRLFKLISILKEICPEDIWYSVRRRRGYAKKTHYRPPSAYVPNTRISKTPSLLKRLKEQFKPVATLRSESPRQVLIGLHGPNILLSPVREEKLRSGLTPQEKNSLNVLEQQRRARQLMSQRGLCVGGFDNRMTDLAELSAIEPADELKELEPLRALSLQEVTNVSLLKAYNKINANDQEEE